jgi:hypothetical protein
MRRILKCSKDTYITNKIINGVRVTDANVGQAGTLDLFKLYDETTLSGSVAPVELSRVLLKFDLAPLYQVTNSININSPSFKCFLKLSDVYGGQPVPSNFTLSLYPLAKPFSEGRGSDVVAYRDVDSTNWITSSYGSTWSVTGAYMSGSLGTSGVDYYHSGALPTSGTLGVFQTFDRGDENLLMDVTSLVSGTIAGLIPDNGFRLSFTKPMEEDGYTYFVKRFTSRQSSVQSKHPRIEVLVDSSNTDQTLASYFNISNSVGTYNTVFGSYRNFFSGSTEITGANSLLLTLVTSRSIYVQTTSWSDTHSASITYASSAFVYFSSSFVGSQLSNPVPQTGIYTASFFLNTQDPYFGGFIGNRSFVDIQPLWQSLDGTVTYSSGSYFTVNRIVSSTKNVAERNYVVNVTNLKAQYVGQETARLRLFIQDYNTELRYNKIPIDLTSEVYSNVHWRLLDSYSKEIIVDFDAVYNSTKLSSDGSGMYFDMFMTDLPVNKVYEFEFLVKENGQDYMITNQGFRFKVIP